jgi:23S rRNA (uracil1939-C5)-methyltransferase
VRQGLNHVAPMSADLLTVKFEKLIYGGDALGRLPDGRAVFIPFGIPGETVHARIIEEKRGHVRAELADILEASPGRNEARCKHFGICGGCHYQHLSYLEQQKVKTGILLDQLMRIGKIKNPPVDNLVPSPKEWNYRNHIQFHLTRPGKLGFVEALSPNILPIQECHLPEARLNSLWPSLEFDPGLDLERVSLRQGMDEQVMVILESTRADMPALELEADLSVVHTTGEDSIVMAGDDHLLMQVNGRNFHVSSESFFQVNTAVAGLMADHLLAQLPVSTFTNMLDVYCGVGFFSAFFAARVGRLIGIESSPSACEDFSINLDEFENVELFEAPAEQVLPALDVSPDVVIVDPPRAGLDKRVLEAIVALAPDHLAYVSCDPSTLARDASRLIAGGYRLKQVTPFDLFPQTYHIESISIFEKG